MNQIAPQTDSNDAHRGLQGQYVTLPATDLLTILESLEEISGFSSLNARQIKLRAQIKLHLASLESAS